MSVEKPEVVPSQGVDATFDHELDITHIMTIPANTVVAYQVMELLINSKDGTLNNEIDPKHLIYIYHDTCYVFIYTKGTIEKISKRGGLTSKSRASADNSQSLPSDTQTPNPKPKTPEETSNTVGPTESFTADSTNKSADSKNKTPESYTLGYCC